MRTRGARGRNDILNTRARLAIGDILSNRPVEEEGLLQHDANMLSEVLEGDIFDIDAIHGQRPAVDLVKSTEQVHRGRLAGAATANQANHLTCLDIKINALEDRVGLIVAKADIREFDIPLEHRQLDRIRLVVGLRLGIDDFEDAFRTRHRA